MHAAEVGSTHIDRAIHEHDDVVPTHVLVKPHDESVTRRQAQTWRVLASHAAETSDSFNERRFRDGYLMTCGWPTECAYPGMTWLEDMTLDQGARVEKIAGH